ncbi:MAG: GAP family protein [Trebonia sp.]
MVLMLTTRRARVNGPLFVLGWLAGLAVVGAIVLSVAGPAGANSSGSPATWVSWVKVVPGLLLLLVAARQFRGRPKDGEQAHLPKWMARIDDIRPLAGLKDWMGQHNAAIMSVLCLVIGDRRRHQRADYLTTKVKINIHPERLVLTFPAHRASGPRAARRPASGCRSARRFTRRG